MLHLNPNLDQLPVYQPGRPVEDVARERGFQLSDVAKLASNENPLGPSPAAVEAMRDALEGVHLYPDGNAFYLKRQISESFEMSERQVIVGNGSNELIEFVAHALLGPGSNIVVSQFCFAIYPIVANMMGAEVITVPALDYGADLDAMAEAVTDQTRILFLANPNNPTGTLADGDSVMDLIRSVDENVLVVIDEAYIEYLEAPQDLLSLVRKGTVPNLLLMRTFSKIHGLAGLRLGYGFGSEALIGALEKIRQPFNSNLLAQKAATAALKDRTHVASSRRHNRKERLRFEAVCRERGWEIVPSFANFVLIRVGDGNGVYEALLDQGIITRPMAGYQLPEWIRISIGTEAENERCLKALTGVLA